MTRTAQNTLLALLVVSTTHAPDAGAAKLAANAAIYVRVNTDQALDDKAWKPFLSALRRAGFKEQLPAGFELQLALMRTLFRGKTLRAALGIPDLRSLRKILRHRGPPGRRTRAPLLRAQVLIPLALLPPKLPGGWVRRTDPRWAKMVARLKGADRRAAKKAQVMAQSFEYIGLGFYKDQVLELRLATGGHSFARLARPFRPASAGFLRELEARGFNKDRVAFHIRPAQLVLAGQALGAVSVLSALSAAAPDQIAPLWKEALRELRTIAELPKLARPALIKSATLSETGLRFHLTPTGVKQLAGLPFPKEVNKSSVERLARALSKRIRTPAGNLLRLIQEGGHASTVQAVVFLWPQALAWTAAHQPQLLQQIKPGKLPVRLRWSLDRKRQELRVEVDLVK